MIKSQSQKHLPIKRTSEIKSSNNSSEKRIKTDRHETVTIFRKRNVKKPFISNRVAILYTPRLITLKPRSTIELNMKLTFDYSDYLLPECNLLPSFKKHLALHTTEIEKGSTYKVILINKSFCDCLRIVKDTGIVYFTILNQDCKITYKSQYN